MVEFKHVYKAYGTNKPCLRDISFSVQQGEFVFITGASGAGKTTLFKLISAYEKLTSGEITVLGHSLTDLKAGNIPFLRRKIGLVLQNHRLLKNKSVYENIAMPLQILNYSKKEINIKTNQLIEQMGLIEVKDQFPDFLSGGEQQRIAIARALVHEPRLVIADEPTGNLDPDLSKSILQLFENKARSQTTFLMATHDYRLIENSRHRILSLKEGQISG